MSTLKISLNNIRSTVKVEIGGHIYTARKLGAGEELDAAASSRRLFGLIDQLDALQKNKLLAKDSAKLSISDKKKQEKLAKQLELLMTELESIQREQFNISVSMLDDGVGGEKSREVIGSLTVQERNVLFAQIFDGKPKDKDDEDNNEVEGS